MNLEHHEAVCQVRTRNVPSKTGEPGTAETLGIAGFLIFLFQVFQVNIDILKKKYINRKKHVYMRIFYIDPTGSRFFLAHLEHLEQRLSNHREEDLSWQIKS